MAGKILQLKIVLDDIKPPIWRRIQVADSFTFHELHLSIQAVMGWYNYHLHEFTVGGIHIEDPKQVEDPNGIYVNSRKIRLSKFVAKEKLRFHYLYDFGDCWEHTITVEKVLEGDATKLPICIDGIRACPPEDCGGSPGYESLLEILADKDHTEHKEMKEWAGDDFDPECFDLKKANRRIGRYRSMENETL